jgi:phage terminase large subunit-like protein
MAGRGFGKTRSATEWVRQEVMAGRAARVQLVSSTAGDVRDVIVEGRSGIIKVCERYGWRVHYEPSKRRITFPNGAIATTFSADEPDRLRGPEFYMALWDEFAAWRDPEAVTNAEMGVRLTGPKGHQPRTVIPTTPKRTPHLKTVYARRRTDDNPDGDVVVTGGRTEENAANLDPAWMERMTARYAGTSTGRQELGGELLDDVEGAKWSRALIEATRCTKRDVPQLLRIVVGVDPQGSVGGETGIVAAGLGKDKRGYVLDDVSLDASPGNWGRAVVNLYRDLKADRIVVEKNFGGDMVISTIGTVDPKAAVKAVSASRGKLVRAEPVAALYEQGKVSHVGAYPALEDEMTGYDGTGPSPNRMDALVWTLTELMVEDAPKDRRLRSIPWQ